MILDAIMGLIILLCAYTILETANPATTQLDAVRVQSAFEAGEAKTDTEAEETPAQPSSTTPPSGGGTGNAAGKTCSDDGFRITNPAAADFKNNQSTYKEIAAALDQQHINAYKKASNEAGIPWELFAAVDYKEAGMNLHGSALNGDKYCNTKDYHDLLTQCPRCSDATMENDFFCTAQILAKSAPGVTRDNLDGIKLALCKHNGCTKSQISCPEKHTYVSNKFDALHSGFVKSKVDHLTTSCTPGCVRDFTKEGGSKKTCCTLRKYKSTLTSNNIIKCCKDDPNDSSITVCDFIPGPRDQSNPCGTSVPDNRPGGLLIYSIILDLEKQGRIQ